MRALCFGCFPPVGGKRLLSRLACQYETGARARGRSRVPKRCGGGYRGRRRVARRPPSSGLSPSSRLPPWLRATSRRWRGRGRRCRRRSERAGGVEAGEGLQRAGAVGLGDAGAVVLDDEGEPLVGEAHGQEHAAAVAGGVADEVLQRARDRAGAQRHQPASPRARAVLDAASTSAPARRASSAIAVGEREGVGRRRSPRGCRRGRRRGTRRASAPSGRRPGGGRGSPRSRPSAPASASCG